MGGENEGGRKERGMEGREEMRKKEIERERRNGVGRKEG